uniref:Sialidase NEU1.1 n=1 Tax=Karenia brevis TaxID=156230 RepID=K0PUR2_KARBR|nr:TPA_inf: sialidase NEU1.1 [Karenia brevis]
MAHVLLYTRMARVLCILMCSWCHVPAFAWMTPECQNIVRSTCVGHCYPELAGVPCDDIRCKISSDGRDQPKMEHCNCSWNAKMANLLATCDSRADGSVTVFGAGEANISCFRIPAIVRTVKGTLLAFAEARHGGCGDGQVHQIAVRRSIDQGKTWSELTFAAGSDQLFVGNPYPIAMSGGDVALVFVNHTHGHGADLGSGNGVIFSRDDGITWSAPLDISQGFGAATGSLPGPGAGIELGASHRMLVVSHHGAYVNDYISYSDDRGTTWKTIGQTFPKMDEATLADLGGGSVLLNMRHRAENTKGRGVARSQDGGLSWSNITYDSALIGPVCQGSMAAFNGSVFFSNPASSSGRDHLTVRRSDDGGHTWTAKLLIQEGRSAGYSSLVQGPVLDDNHGGILYESTAAGSVDFTVFPLNFQDRDLTVIV